MKKFNFSLLWKRIKAIPSLLLDPSANKQNKILIGLGILYLISPVDFLPAFIPLASILDDVLICGIIIFILRNELDTYIPNAASFRYKGKNIIDADFEEKEEDYE